MSGRRRLRTFAWPASAALAAALLIAPGAASAQTPSSIPIVIEEATSGDVEAELWHRGHRYVRVRIARDGVLVYDRRIRGRCTEFCQPAESALTGQRIGFRDVDGTGEPEVIVDLFTGGASCCVLVLAFGYDAAANTYRPAKLDAGGGFVVRDPDADGVPELVGDDFRFRGLFTCGACGPRPIRIWRYGLGRFEVVTKDFPERILMHARRTRRFYARVRDDGEAAFVKGALTPLVADLCLLDRCGRGFRLVRAAIRRGELERRSVFDVSPLGTNYMRALKRFLRRTGYLG